MVATPERATPASMFAPGQKVGPQQPGQESPVKYEYDNQLLDKNKVEGTKADSGHLRFPLQQEMADLDEISISHDSMIILKHHGSYMQQNRDLQRSDKAGYAASYQFMLRLKNPCGKIDAKTYQAIDDLSNKYGQGDLRATTRMAWQIHGVKKENLKKVIAGIAEVGGSTLGGCGDINRNIMTPPAPLADPAYQHVFQTANFIAELFKPSSPAFEELWMDAKKPKDVEYWRKDMVEGSTGKNHIPPVALTLEELDKKISEAQAFDQGTGIITGDPEEPLYGRCYLPRKFKIAVTVPGDNSMDIFIHDVSLIVIMDEDGKTLKGYNVMVGGGMGRTHNKESTFARVNEMLGYIPKEDLTEAMKAILATQRDHGNRQVRANARLKYLVHTLGIDNFRTLAEKYFGKSFQPAVPLPEWHAVDWLGWHPQGDGDWFVGINVQQGRVKDEGDFKLKTALRKIVDTYGTDIRLTANQNIVICGVKPKDKEAIQALLTGHGIKDISEIDAMTRKSIACPAFPLCGLAQAEAERVMPDFNARVGALLDKMGMPGESFIMRMTGCPNGCARPYMAELAFVGQGPDLYQVWMGGSPNLDGRTGWRWKDKVKAAEMETTLEPIFYMWKTQRSSQAERFGDFTTRVGIDAINAYIEKYETGTAFKNVVREELAPLTRTVTKSGTMTKPRGSGARLTSGPRKQQIRVTDELHSMLKAQAEAEGLHISDLVEQLLVHSVKK